MSASRRSAHEDCGEYGTQPEGTFVRPNPVRRSELDMSEKQKRKEREQKFGRVEKGEDRGLISSRKPSVVGSEGSGAPSGNSRGSLASRVTRGGIHQALNMMQTLPPSTVTPSMTTFLPSAMSGMQHGSVNSAGLVPGSGLAETISSDPSAPGQMRTGKWRRKKWYHFKRGDVVRFYMVQEEQNCDPPRYVGNEELVPREGLVDLIPNAQIAGFVKLRYGIIIEVHVTHAVILPLHSYEESGLAKRPRYQHYQFANVRFELDVTYQKQSTSIPDEWTLSIADTPEFGWRPNELTVLRLATPVCKQLDTRMWVVGRLTPDSRNRCSIMYARSRTIGTLPARYCPWAAADNPWLLGMDSLPSHQMPKKWQRDSIDEMDVDYPGDNNDPPYTKYMTDLCDRSLDPVSISAIEAIRIKRNDALEDISSTHKPWVIASETYTVAQKAAVSVREAFDEEESRYAKNAPGTYDVLAHMNSLETLRIERKEAEEQFSQAIEIFTFLQKEIDKAWKAFYQADKELEDAEASARNAPSNEVVLDNRSSRYDRGQPGAKRQRMT
ncbi:hypothetical protein K491DRAFT_714223 [Lophiostoma macrostomum CBS 122681]|uniref:Uncharacterized protein n=1 Tax=Lophiostoma macrostomum CBS 122681 TaxID=1314788 RepID=A0A6A6TD60_9PLEO|nr:hypothetical protein K491DRAFT_714223 [Lophiostoma macrostomum CBS 122681]